MLPKQRSLSHKSGYIDIAFLAIIGLIIANTFFRYYRTDFVLSFNTYWGIGLWVAVIAMAVFKFKYKMSAVVILLLLATFNIINFTLETVWIRMFNLPDINPIFFILLLIYSIVNRAPITLAFKKSFYPNEQETKDKQEVMINFYSQKFKSLNSTELETAFKNFKDYPVEAQVALKQIHIE